MKEIILEISCCLCSEKYQSKINIPENWSIRYDVIYEEQGLCPNHNKIKEFIDSQCSGCVGGWGDCNLWRDFAYRDQNLTEKDFKIMRTGICPRRTNGTLIVDNSQNGLSINELNLSEKAKKSSGIALERAIKDYWKKYSKNKE